MRSRTLAAAALTAALALSGCSGGDPEPKFEPETSSAASTTKASEPTTDPSPTEPVELGPAQVVRAWVDAYNLALETGDPAVATALTTDDCKTCRWEIDPLVEVHQNGGRFKGGRWSVASAKVTRRSGDASATVSAAIRVAGGRTVPRRRADPVNYDAESKIIQFGVERVDGAWLIRRIWYLS